MNDKEPQEEYEESIDFEEAVLGLAIDLTPGRMTPHTLLEVAIEHRVRLGLDELLHDGPRHVSVDAPRAGWL